MKLTEDEHREIGEALSMMDFVVRKLRLRAWLRFAVILVFMLIGWFNGLYASSPWGSAFSVLINHGLALAWWIGFRKYWLASLKAQRARTLMESCVWWERLGDGEQAMSQMEEVSRLTNELDNISI